MAPPAGPAAGLLFLASIPSTVLSGPAPAQPWTTRAGSAVIGSLIMAFLLWRVRDGGRFSGGLLPAGGFAAYVGGLFVLAREWDLPLAARLGYGLTCLAVLTSPAVRQRLRHPGAAAPASATGRRRPPGWILPWALVAGAADVAAAQQGLGTRWLTQRPGSSVPRLSRGKRPGALEGG